MQLGVSVRGCCAICSAGSLDRVSLAEHLRRDHGFEELLLLAAPTKTWQQCREKILAQYYRGFDRIKLGAYVLPGSSPANR